jgi:tagatose 1,6-diphosphate aldolase
LTKADHLKRLSTSDGIIAAMAIDQRKSLRIMIANAAGVPLDSISDEQLGEFKRTVVRHLTPYASAVLIDPEFGQPAIGAQDPKCGLLLTYEMDGYENPRPNRMLALMPEWSVRRLGEAGADGIKILLSWNPFDETKPNDEKKVLIERIGAECHANHLPFFLEPVGYDPSGRLDPKSAEYAKLKPEIVIRTMEEFSDPRYHVDILKVEFPVNVSYVGSEYSHEKALELYRLADAASRGIPYIYLSAGVSAADFTKSLRLAAESGAHFSGVLCGRATWQDGVPAYACGGVQALEQWLETDGVRNIQAVNECLKGATPWHETRVVTA